MKKKLKKLWKFIKYFAGDITLEALFGVCVVVPIGVTIIAELYQLSSVTSDEVSLIVGVIGGLVSMLYLVFPTLILTDSIEDSILSFKSREYATQINSTTVLEVGRPFRVEEPPGLTNEEFNSLIQRIQELHFNDVPLKKKKSKQPKQLTLELTDERNPDAE